jgi:serine O-acetyltransferase
MANHIAAVDWHAYRLYRLSHWLWLRGHRASAGLVAAISRMLTGVDIGPGADFGPGLVIRHGHGLVVAPSVRAGRDCALYQGVTLATRPGGVPPRDGAPTLGDRVTIFPGATVLGAITVGDGARIGANAVVIHDVPAGATVTAPIGRIA